MEIVVVGGGIAGLSLAIGLNRRGISCRVYESAPEVKEIGVGITLLPHATREFASLGLLEKLEAVAIENEVSKFFNRWGQLIYQEPRGRFAGYDYPELGLHRGKLHGVLYRSAQEQLGPAGIVLNHQCLGVDQDERGANAYFRETSSGAQLRPIRADIIVACDGVNSAVRRQFYPHEQLAFAGINTWRGVTRRAPILGGRTYMRLGSIETGKIVIYPIVDDVDGRGRQLINWMTEIRQPSAGMNDWNAKGQLEDFFPIYQDWRFDWLDVAELISSADQILEYPMVDKDPVPQWTFGRIALMGDAAHPMYPRGSNGAAQAAIDARVLADLIGQGMEPVAALKAYESARLPAANQVVEANRKHPPDYINVLVDQRTGGQPFDRIDDVVSQEELRKISEDYKRLAGFALDSSKESRS